MTAQEIREKQKEYNKGLGDDKHVYDDIILGVQNHIKKYNDEEMWYYITIPKRVADKLGEDGFYIKNVSDRDGTMYKISWAKK